MVILLTMTTLSLADAKAHLSKLIARVSGQHERVYVTVHGKPSAVLLATEDLESLEETIEILADADTMRRLHPPDAEVAGTPGRLKSPAGPSRRSTGSMPPCSAAAPLHGRGPGPPRPGHHPHRAPP